MQSQSIDKGRHNNELLSLRRLILLHAKAGSQLKRLKARCFIQVEI
jgi:hypothetical protein